MSKKILQEDVIQRFISIHGGVYDYSMVVYAKMKSTVQIICKTHGVFRQKPETHLSGSGCPLCSASKIKHITHGMSNHPGYRYWVGMMRRCYDTKFKHFDKHGGRGILVSDKLKDVHYFCNYISTIENYDKISEGGYSLDRIDTYGNYEEGNLRFATYSTQSINQRLRRNNKTGYVGIFKVNDNTYSATVEHGKLRFSKKHRDLESAITWRNEIITKHNLPNKINVL